MTSNDSDQGEISKLIKDSTDSWIECLTMICLDYESSIRHRALVIIENISKYCKESAEILVKSNLKEILSGMAQDVDISWGDGIVGDGVARDLLKKLCQNVLD